MNKKIYLVNLLGSLMALGIYSQASAAVYAEKQAVPGTELMPPSGEMIFFGILYLIIPSFIFSAIFWLVHNWIAKK